MTTAKALCSMVWLFGQPLHATFHPFVWIFAQRPTDKFAVVFTKNAFPGAPIRVGRQRLKEPYLQAIVVNNKVRHDLC